MTLSYRPITSNIRKRIKATITTEHALSSYGVPVIILSSGEVLNLASAILLDYRIERIKPEEQPLVKQWQQAIAMLA